MRNCRPSAGRVTTALVTDMPDTKSAARGGAAAAVDAQRDGGHNAAMARHGTPERLAALDRAELIIFRDSSADGFISARTPPAALDKGAGRGPHSTAPSAAQSRRALSYRYDQYFPTHGFAAGAGGLLAGDRPAAFFLPDKTRARDLGRVRHGPRRARNLRLQKRTRFRSSRAVPNFMTISRPSIPSWRRPGVGCARVAGETRYARGARGRRRAAEISDVQGSGESAS